MIKKIIKKKTLNLIEDKLIKIQMNNINQKKKKIYDDKRKYLIEKGFFSEKENRIFSRLKIKWF